MEKPNGFGNSYLDNYRNRCVRSLLFAFYGAKRFIMDIPIHKRIEHVCKTIYDPEIPQNIWDLGLVYNIGTELFEKKGLVDITMTLTTPSCPVGPEFLNNVKTRVEEIKEIKECKVDLVWDPPWDASMMSEEAQTMLGMELNRPMLDGTRAGGHIKGNWE